MYKYTFTPITGVNLRFNYFNLEKNDLNDNKNAFNSQSLIAELSEKSIQSMSDTTGKTGAQTIESSVKQEMRNYIRQLIQEELESQQIKEKLSIVSLSKLEIEEKETNDD